MYPPQFHAHRLLKPRHFPVQMRIKRPGFSRALSRMGWSWSSRKTGSHCQAADHPFPVLCGPDSLSGLTRVFRCCASFCNGPCAAEDSCPLASGVSLIFGPESFNLALMSSHIRKARASGTARPKYWTTPSDIQSLTPPDIQPLIPLSPLEPHALPGNSGRLRANPQKTLAACSSFEALRFSNGSRRSA